MLTKSATPDLVLGTAPDDRLSDRFSGGVDRVWRVSLCLLGVQLIGMLVFTTVQYQRFNLTNDFAGYAQAWTAIAHGHMSPFSSVLTVPFWRNDFELLMWPLALFYWVYPHAVTLLWLQVFAVVGGELVALSWARDAVKRRPQDKGLAAVLLGLVAALLLLTPWSWYTIGFDFHFVPFAALFALLAGSRPLGRPLSARPCCVGSPYAAVRCRWWRSSCHRGGLGRPAEQERVAPCGVSLRCAGPWLVGPGVRAGRDAL